ncbi:MAG: hypothetical protein QM733_23635 [Ilumatobacteraceae bacterium]
MSSYWFTFVEEQTEEGSTVTAISPARTDRRGLDRSARAVLAAADIYRDDHPNDTVVFLAEVTHWLADRHDLTWPSLDVDLDAAITNIAEWIEAVVIDVSPLALVIVATGGRGIDPSIAAHLEPVRRAIDETLRAQPKNELLN